MLSQLWGWCFSFIVMLRSCLILFRTLQSPDEIVDKSLRSFDGSTTCEDFVGLAQSWLNKIQVLQNLVMKCSFWSLCHCDAHSDWMLLRDLEGLHNLCWICHAFRYSGLNYCTAIMKWLSFHLSIFCISYCSYILCFAAVEIVEWCFRWNKSKWASSFRILCLGIP